MSEWCGQEKDKSASVSGQQKEMGTAELLARRPAELFSRFSVFN